MNPSTAISAETIRSRQNARLKELRQRLLRPQTVADGLIAVEGENLLREAVRSGLAIDKVFFREDQARRTDWPAFGDAATFVVAAEAFDHACVTESPQGVAALVQAPQWSLEELLQREITQLVVLTGLQDPGNVGTVIRAAEAFGASGVLLTMPSVHPWNQKLLRASTGSSFRVPVIPLANVNLLARVSELGIPLYACTANAGESLYTVHLRGPNAFVIGNEGSGIPQEILPFCSGTIHVPCPGPVESLNAGVAAAILMYEASRQRSQPFAGTNHEPV